MTNYPTDTNNRAYSPQFPQPIADTTQSSDISAVSGETVTFLSSAAAGSTGINALAKGPIMNVEGDRVGSYWDNRKDNLVYEATHEQGNFRTVVETALSAVVTIFDDGRNLEQLFETVTGSTLVKRFVIKVTDEANNKLYGWVTNIAVASNVYTIDVFDTRLAEAAQSWVGTLAAFDNTALKKVEIFKYSSSLAWTTGTVLTEEVGYTYQREHGSDIDFISSLSNGQYAVDYMRGRLLFKKATTGTSDTLAYTSRGASVAASGPTIDSLTQVAINVPAGAVDTVLVSSAANKQIWVYGVVFVVDIAGTISIQDEDNVAITGVMPFGVNGGMTISPSGNFAIPLWKLGTDKDLEVDTVTCTLDGSITYAIVDVS